jgi:hypothetical protein
LGLQQQPSGRCFWLKLIGRIAVVQSLFGKRLFP